MSKHKRGIYNVAGKETRRKELRNSPTVAETVLWNHLKDRQLDGKKFRRQSSVGPYIVDFFVRKSALLWNWMGRDTLDRRRVITMIGERGTWRKEGSR